MCRPRWLADERLLPRKDNVQDPATVHPVVSMNAIGHAAAPFLELAALAFRALYWLVLTLLSVYGIHRIVLVVRYLRHRRKVPSQPPTRTVLPAVTVQLPLYNEANVAGRLHEATGQLRYPRHLLDVQVLDDSTDETREVVDDRVKQLRSEGLHVEVLRRQKREGFKAGALAAGLERAAGDVLLVLDADFVPPPDLLERAIGHFDDPTVGMVQARWSHLNEAHSRLTRTQALMLDGHFIIEHAARARAGGVLN
jgi:cellulose synthase/poly-beta-1,6-N-acetylglucosamine synthase-like glycosyltransferase